MSIFNRLRDCWEFKAYGPGGEFMIHTWALHGHSADLEREVYLELLRKGHYSKVLMWRRNEPHKVTILTKDS